jgi:hypothetical protein
MEMLAPTAGRADLAAAVAAANGHDDVDNVIVLTDSTAPMHAHGLESRAVQWVRVGQPVENAAVTQVAARRASLGSVGGQALIVVHNYGTRAREDDVELSVDGNPVRRSRVTIAPAASEEVTMALPDLGRVITARLVGEDALPLDDVRSVAVPAANRVRVALAGRRGSFLERALAVNPTVTLTAVDLPNPAADVGASAADNESDVLVCDRCGTLPEMRVPTLLVDTAGGERGRGVLVVTDARHPLANALTPNSDMVTAFRSTSQDGRGDVIVRAGTAPAVTAVETDGRRIVTVHLDLSQADFALTPAFPVLIANAIEWLAGRDDVPSEGTAGEPLVFRLPGVAANQLHVFGPDGRTRHVDLRDQQFIVGDTDAAGQYHIRADGVDHVIPVNAAVGDESNLSVSSSELPGEEDGTVRAVNREAVPLGPWFAFLGLVFSTLEWRAQLTEAS